MKSSFEVAMLLLVTGVTNLCMFPAIVNLHQQKYVFEVRALAFVCVSQCGAQLETVMTVMTLTSMLVFEFIGAFTMVTSFMYHCCDSIDGPLWLTEGQWHRLDNIGSIMSFIIWSIHLMDLPNPLHQRYLHYIFLALVLVFQEKNPWDEWNSVAPILICFFVLFLSFAVRKQIPRYDYVQLRRGIFFLGCAVCCFIRGLDDENDPFRFFHGCWHAFVGAAAYFNFRILPSPHTKAKASHLPFKKY